MIVNERKIRISKLAIFDTFKTKDDDLQEKQKDRERSLEYLQVMQILLKRLEQEFHKRLQKNKDIAWKNIYSGIFRDLDEILASNGISRRRWQIAFKKRSKGIQEKGIPYYHLTKKGILIAYQLMILKKRKFAKEFFQSQSHLKKRV